MLRGIPDIRLENVEKLMAETGLGRKDFANKFDMSYNMFSQYFSAGKSRKTIGDKVARRIETAFEKPEFWLDNEHTSTYPSIVAEAIANMPPYVPHLVKIPRLDARASCGPGHFDTENPEIIGYDEFPVEYIRSKGLPVDGHGLYIITADGDSMYPTIPDKTPLLVNTNEREFDMLITSKVYVFCANGSVICKRVIRNLDGSIILRSDNEEYKDQLVNEEEFHNFVVIGRLKVALVDF